MDRILRPSTEPWYRPRTAAYSGVRWGIACAVVLTVCVFADACARTSTPKAMPGTVARTVQVAEVPVPALNVPYYKTTGSFPQIESGPIGISFDAVNRSLRLSVAEDQREYAAIARQQEAEVEAAGKPTETEMAYPGLYDVSPRPDLIAANTTLISALMPVQKLFPGGVDGAVWLSSTVQVPSGEPVSLVDLLAVSESGLNSLSMEAAKELTQHGICGIGPSMGKNDTAVQTEGLKPTVANFKYFALTGNGLALGFPNGQVAAASCGRVEVIIPYSRLGSLWSVLGKSLVATLAVQPGAATNG